MSFKLGMYRAPGTARPAGAPAPATLTGLREGLRSRRPLAAEPTAAGAGEADQEWGPRALCAGRGQGGRAGTDRRARTGCLTRQAAGRCSANRESKRKLGALLTLQTGESKRKLGALLTLVSHWCDHQSVEMTSLPSLHLFSTLKQTWTF